MPGYTTIKDLLGSRPSLKYILFCGKGGVGKSTLSVAMAYWLARRGKRVCVFSADPQGSLSDIFGQSLIGKGEVEVMPNLYAAEIDPDARVAEYQEALRHKLREAYGGSAPEEVEDSIEALAAEPSVVLSTTFDAMVKIMESGRDYYVFDMLPHGHALRLLSMADTLMGWIDKRAGPASEELSHIRSRLEGLSKLIKDRETTAFFYVLNPDLITILGSKEGLRRFAERGILLSGILVNMVYPVELLGQPNLPAYLRNQIISQKKGLEIIREEFGQPLSVVPMFDREPKGAEMISMVAEVLFGHGDA